MSDGCWETFLHSYLKPSNIVKMATVNKNLSDYDINSIPDASKMVFGIVVSEWNENITSGLLNGAYNTLIKHGATEANIIVKNIPGSFELPLAAQTLLEKTNVDAFMFASALSGEYAIINVDKVGEAIDQGIIRTTVSPVLGYKWDNPNPNINLGKK